MKLDKAKGWVAFIIALTTLVGTAFTLDNRYAKQTQTTAKIDSVEQTIQQVEQRLDKKILKDRADVLDGLCLKCFKELPESDTIRKPLREVYEPNEIKPVLNIWSGEMVTWDPFEQTEYKKTKGVN